jgi:excinuclease ABC subunit C
LDDIPGIGSKRKKSLLNHFGSASDVLNASIEDLQRVEGLSKATAEAIYNYFKN